MKDYRQVYDAIKSAMSGNGKFWVNKSIKRLKNCLKEEFRYEHQSFDDLTVDFTNFAMTNHVVKKYEHDKGSFQGYMNTVIENYLKNELKRLRNERSLMFQGKFARQVDMNSIVSQYDLELTNFIEDVVPGTDIMDNPENKVIGDELVDLLHDVFGEESTYLLVYNGKLNQSEGAARTINEKTGQYGISREHFNRKYREKISELEYRLEDGGYTE